MSTGGQRLRARLLAVPFVYLLACGSTFVSCSSGTGDGIFDPDNRAPVAFDSTVAATVNVPIDGFMQALDDDGDALVFRIVDGPDFGSVRIDDARTGAFMYTGSAAGTDRFSFRAEDGIARSNIATVTVAVQSARLANAELSDRF